MKEIRIEKRSEPRTELEKYHSVEFRTTDQGSLYRFKIWNISSRGMCVLVRDDSDVIADLTVGKVLKMKYYTTNFSTPPKEMKTEIKHITKEEEGHFKGHCLVGLYVTPAPEEKA